MIYKFYWNQFLRINWYYRYQILCMQFLIRLQGQNSVFLKFTALLNLVISFISYGIYTISYLRTHVWEDFKHKFCLWFSEVWSILTLYKSSHRMCSVKKMFLKISQYLQANTRAGAKFLRKRQKYRCFSVYITKF